MLRNLFSEHIFDPHLTAYCIELRIQLAVLEDNVEHEVQKSRTQVERANEAPVDKFLENLPNFHCFLLIILSTKICNCSFVYISHTI